MDAACRTSSHPLPPRRHVRRLQARLLGWYATNGRELPWRHTTDPYQILVSEVMLQQTQVPRVVPKYLAFLAAFPTLETLAASELAHVLSLWSGLGYNNRAERLRRCARITVEQTGRTGGPAALPTDPHALEQLPGIGPYTARAVRIFAANDDLAAVDANIRRVLTHELDLPPTLQAGELQAIADGLVPPGRSRDWHNALMDYGALVLTARTTGLGPRHRQSAFVGSRRWHRSRLLRAALATAASHSVESLAAEVGLDADLAAEILDGLARDGLVTVVDGAVRLS